MGGRGVRTDIAKRTKGGSPQLGRERMKPNREKGKAKQRREKWKGIEGR